MLKIIELLFFALAISGRGTDIKLLHSPLSATGSLRIKWISTEFSATFYLVTKRKENLVLVKEKLMVSCCYEEKGKLFFLADQEPLSNLTYECRTYSHSYAVPHAPIYTSVRL